MSLEYKLDTDEMVFWKKEVDESLNEGPENPDRRKFLKDMGKTGITAAGAYVGMSLGLGVSDANAAIDITSTEKALAYLRNPKNNYTDEELKEIEWRVKHLGDKLPPGFAHCRDTIMAFIYGQVHCGLEAFSTGYNFSHPIVNRLTREIGIRDQQVHLQTWFIEPAFHFYRAVGGTVRAGNSFSKNIYEINPALGFFEFGMQCYSSHWGIASIPSNRIRSKSIGVEDNLTKSIFCAGYENQQIGIAKAEEFKGKDLAGKQIMLNEIIGRFKGMKKDIHSIDPNNGYNRCLVAAWSSFMLVNHEARKLNNNGITQYGRLLNENLEVPLRKYVPKIRGPPYYNI